MTTPGSYMELSPTTNHTRPAHVWQVLLQRSSLADISQRLCWKKRPQIHLCRISWVAAGQFRQALQSKCLLQPAPFTVGRQALSVCHHGNLKHIALTVAGSPKNTIWTDFESVCDCEFTGFNRCFCCNTQMAHQRCGATRLELHVLPRHHLSCLLSACLLCPPRRPSAFLNPAVSCLGVCCISDNSTP